MRAFYFTFLALAASASAAQPAGYYEKLARKYFDAWNAHDTASLRPLYADKVTLTDWDVDLSGAQSVVRAAGAIFEAEPKISTEIVTIHEADATKSAICEIAIHLNNAASKMMKGVMILTFDDAGKIEAVRAYKSRVTPGRRKD